MEPLAHRSREEAAGSPEVAARVRSAQFAGLGARRSPDLPRFWPRGTPLVGGGRPLVGSAQVAGLGAYRSSEEATRLLDPIRLGRWPRGVPLAGAGGRPLLALRSRSPWARGRGTAACGGEGGALSPMGEREREGRRRLWGRRRGRGATTCGGEKEETGE